METLPNTAFTERQTVRGNITTIICFLFQILFLYAAFSKLLDYENSRLQLGQSPLLNSWAGLLVWLVPLAEIILSIMLAIKATRLVGMYGAFTLMVVFTAYIVAILHFSDYIPCTCGGVLAALSWQQHLVFNIAFIVLAATGILIHHDSE
jgi:uncharacterized membrane protein YphA (DoxX/SURF4 family)